jgi:hypothetical protein
MEEFGMAKWGWMRAPFRRGTGPTKPNRREWRVKCALMMHTRQPNYFITSSRHAAHLDNWTDSKDNILIDSSQLSNESNLVLCARGI